MIDMVPLQATTTPQNLFGTPTTGEKLFLCFAVESIQSDFLVRMPADNPGSASYFQDYGWVPDSFPIMSEMYTVEIGLSRSDKLYERKARVLETLMTPNPMFYRVKPDLFVRDIEHEMNQITHHSLFGFIRLVQGDEGNSSTVLPWQSMILQ